MVWGLESPVRDKILVSLIIHQIGCPVRDKISAEYSVPNGTAYAHGIVRFSTNIKSLKGFFPRRQSIICYLFLIPK